MSRDVMIGAALLLASTSALRAQADGLASESCATGQIARVVVDNASIFDVDSPELDRDRKSVV